MRIFRKIMFVLIALVAVLLISAVFVKKDYKIEKELIINRPSPDVFNYIKYLKNQNEYSKWAKMDPNMNPTFTGTDAAVGFVSAWEGNKEVGKGEQEIKAIKDGERIDYEIRFIKPWESVAQAYMTTTAVSDNQTKVSWAFSGHMPYPFNLMRLFGMEKMIGNDLQTGLDNLKAIQER